MTSSNTFTITGVTTSSLSLNAYISIPYGIEIYTSPKTEIMLSETEKLPIGTMIESKTSKRIAVVTGYGVIKLPYTTSSISDNSWKEHHEVFDQQSGKYVKMDLSDRDNFNIIYIGK